MANITPDPVPDPAGFSRIGLIPFSFFELDALANKDFHYLTKTYLPKKLKDKDWLDWAAADQGA